MRKSCGVCKYFVLQLSHNSYCTIHIDAEIDVDHIPEWCKDFRQPYGEKEYKVPLEANDDNLD